MKIICNSWITAIKGKKDKVFRIIKNPAYGYAADPFVVEENGKIYIFAELFDYRKGKAGIGYKEINELHTKWKMIIEEDYHLSYPHIFKINDIWYICPESSNNNSVYMYKALSFPDKWEKLNPFISGLKCSDTTLFNENKHMYGVTCLFHEKPTKLLFFKLNNGEVEFSKENPIYSGSKLDRSGGSFIRKDGKLIRVCQDCTKQYGEKLIFTQFFNQWPTFEEKVICELQIKDIEINKFLWIRGIHTYNESAKYQTIDLKIKTFNLRARFVKVLDLIRKHI